MSAGKERRRFPRIPVRFPVRYRLIPISGGEYLEGLVEDLSVEGVRFHAFTDVKPRAGFLFQLQVPGDSPVHAFGRAAWVRELPGKGGFEVGSRFVDQSTASRKALERHLESAPELVGA